MPAIKSKSAEVVVITSTLAIQWHLFYTLIRFLHLLKHHSTDYFFFTSVSDEKHDYQTLS